jgi:hypothetical protein
MSDPGSMSDPSSEPPKLQSLGGERAPVDLGADLALLGALPPEAIGKIWSVLGPAMAEPITPEVEDLLEVFSSSHGIAREDLARPVRACRFLVRGAARFNVGPKAIERDLDALCPDDPLVKEIVLSGFAEVWKLLRQELIAHALRDHGKLLTRVSWRIDQVSSSDQADVVGIPVVLLTLEYLESGTPQRITLQTLPDVMAELRSACDRVLG